MVTKLFPHVLRELETGKEKQNPFFPISQDPFSLGQQENSFSGE
jgi:hypothetical protein